jgi:hypothetical protein
MPLAAVIVAVTHWLTAFVLVNVYESNVRAPVAAARIGVVFRLPQLETGALRLSRPVCVPVAEVNPGPVGGTEPRVLLIPAPGWLPMTTLNSKICGLFGPE